MEWWDEKASCVPVLYCLQMALIVPCKRQRRKCRRRLRKREFYFLSFLYKICEANEVNDKNCKHPTSSICVDNKLFLSKKCFAFLLESGSFKMINWMMESFSSNFSFSSFNVCWINRTKKFNFTDLTFFSIFFSFFLLGRAWPSHLLNIQRVHVI